MKLGGRGIVGRDSDGKPIRERDVPDFRGNGKRVTPEKVQDDGRGMKKVKGGKRTPDAKEARRLIDKAKRTEKGKGGRHRS